MTWIQGDGFEPWEEGHRKSVPARITIEHVMASSALPLVFPAVRLGESWFGDGGVRLSAPLSPALRLGATRVLAISTRYEPSREEARAPQIAGYPPPAQILSHLLDSVFLDVLDEDVRRMVSLNGLLKNLPPEGRRNLRPVQILTVRPSEDLGRLSAAYEPQLPDAFRYLTRSLGTRETKKPDFLSYLMFQPDYAERLMQIGEQDAEARLPELRALIGPEAEVRPPESPEGATA